MNSTTARLQPKTAPSSHRNQTTRKTTANNSLSNFCLALSCNKTSTTLSPQSGVHFRSNRVTSPVNPNHKTMVTSTQLIPNTKSEKGKALPRVSQVRASYLIEQSACGRGGHENCAGVVGVPRLVTSGPLQSRIRRSASAPHLPACRRRAGLQSDGDREKTSDERRAAATASTVHTAYSSTMSASVSHR
jgi:hypothetical protein